MFDGMKIVKIRPYDPDDLNEIVVLFGRSVRGIAGRDYSGEQIDAWAPERPDLDLWSKRLASGTVLVAEVAGRVSGFARLEHSGSIDLLFVSPEIVRQGVGTALMAELLAKARTLGIGTLSAEVSVVARPFFETHGFKVVRDQSVFRRGVELRNHSMERTER
ncbi:MAG: GNAT family N-acetyltransferase [Pseudomonadota bacterium]